MKIPFGGTLLLAIVSICAPVVPVHAQKTSDREIVEGLFPVSLKRVAHADHLATRWSRTSLDRAPGAESIVAIYTNGSSAAVSVISAAVGAVPRVAAVVATSEMTGIAPRLELVDLDNDGIPEIAATFGSAGGNYRTWLFKWSADKLKTLGPTTAGHRGSEVTLLHDPLFLDVNGDGTRDAINFPDDEMASHNPAEVYLLRDGTFVPSDMEVVFYDVFVKREGLPEEQQVSFPIDDVRSTYVVTIINGRESGAEAVTTSKISVNGLMLITGSDSAGSARLVHSSAFKLSRENVVTVALYGAPESFVQLLVQRKVNHEGRPR